MAFQHFPRELQGFFKALKKNNSKDWLDAHRADYDNLLMEPAKDFVEAMGPPLQKIAPGIRAEPRVNGSIMRMNRDTRFSKDKTPYKTAIHFIFWEGAGKAKDSPGLYLKFDDKEVGMAVGMMGFDPARLDRFRKAILDDVSGKALEKAIKSAAKPPYDLRDPHYKKVPRGFDADHPRGDLLRQNSLVVGGEAPLPDALYGGDFVAHCVHEFKKLRPVQAWLSEHVA
ncbi:MAG: DUF2461 domain-containing protein [Alphaproteobacteria bacterium]